MNLLEQLALWLQAVMVRLEPVFNLFRHSEVAIGLSITMLVVALFCLFQMGWRTSPIRRDLNRLSKLVKSKNASYADFKIAYPEIKDELSAPDYLSHGWKEFDETVTVTDAEDGEPVRNTVRPHMYLNIHAVEASGKSFRVLQAAPNYFVGFGLLFTFLGLVSAIYFASQGVVSPDVKVAQQSLQNLLSAATFKFMTSIVGLFSSIVLSIAYKKFMQSLQHSFDRLCQELERGMLFTSMQSIAFERLRESKEQTAQLKRFNTDFAVEVGKVLEEKFRGSMQDSLSAAMQPLSQALESMAGNFGKMNQDALADMTKSFGEDIRGAAGKEMEALVSALDNIQGALGDVVGQINQTSSNFSDTLAASASRVEELMEAAGGQINDQASEAANTFATKVEESSAGLANSLAPLSNQLSRFEAVIGDMETRMTAQREAFADVAKDVQEITSDASQTIRDLKTASAPMLGVAEKLAMTAQRIDGTGKAISETHEHIKGLSSSLNETSGLMQEAWLDYQTRFENVDKSLGASIDQLMTGANAYREHVQSFVTDLDRELDKAVRSLGGGIQELNESIEELIEQRADKSGVR